jgi:hypothetical protein
MVAKETPAPASVPSPARRRGRIALFALLLLGLLGAGHFLWRMSRLDRELQQATYRGELLTPHGIVDWELAFTPGRAERILSAWRSQKKHGGGELVLLARESLRLDHRFIVFYCVALIALCLLIGGAFPRPRRAAWHCVTALPALAGALDWTKNALLVRQFAGTYATAPWAGVAAAAKFALLAATVIALLVIAFAWLGRRLGSPRTRAATPLTTVVAAERRYLAQRRQRAGIPARDHPFGLALSGGGLRSATLNLGVLQALARRRVLPQFDYLSTVSGGGYIGCALSSLLSINGSRISSSPQGGEDQYLFDRLGDEHDKAWFSTAEERFPFNERDTQSGSPACEGFSGGAQMRHLRAAGEFLVGRRRLFSIEMLRALGSVLVGSLYHLIHFGLFGVALSAGYLWVVYLMAGNSATRFAEAGEYQQFVGQAFGTTIERGWGHPFLTAALAGFLTTALTLVLAQRLLARLPDRWFERPGMTVGRSRNVAAVLAMVVTMLGVGFGLASWVRLEFPDNLLNLSIPLVSYLGAGTCLGLLHAGVKTSRRFGRSQRSQLAAQEGAFILLALMSLALVLFILPFLVFFDPLVELLSAWPLGSLFGWLLTLLGARMFVEGDPEADAKGALARRLASLPVLRKALLSLVVFTAVLGGLLLICVQIWRLEPQAAPGSFRLTVSLVATALFLVTGHLFDFNRLSLHLFYRDRLAEAYLRTTEADRDRANALRPLRDNEAQRLEDLHGRPRTGGAGECVTTSPYHLVVTCLNLSSDASPRQARRKTDQFTFSRLYCGSETTGFVETGVYRAGETQVADAMAISGAAASPAMGTGTFFAQSAAMTLFNVRLGQWLENPAYGGARSPRFTFWPWYLLREIFGSCDATQRLVYLSDGGHSGDNLGIYPLLKRRCRLILAVDAGRDPQYSGNSLVEALRQARIDEGIMVDIDLAPLRPGKDGTPGAAHFVCGSIDYPRQRIETDDDAQGAGGSEEEVVEASSGWLIVLKSSLSGDEPEMIVNYKRHRARFPHETTGDLFFDDAQFEAYRQLGEHLVDTLLDTNSVCRSELEAVSGAP